MDHPTGLFHTQPFSVQSHEKAHRNRILNTAIFVTFIAGFALGALSLPWKQGYSGLTLVTLAFLCIPIYLLNKQGKQNLAAGLLLLLIYIVLGFNMYDGRGLHDIGIIACAMFILLGTLFFGKRAAPLLFLATVALLASITLLESTGYIIPVLRAGDTDDLLIGAILLGLGTGIVWVLLDNRDKDLKRLHQSEHDLRTAYELTLEGWAKALEYRDRETEGHCRRVTEMAVQLARAYGCSEEEITHIRRGALLHDIGKIAIPDHVLLKPGTLSGDERELIQRHPEYARDMLQAIPFLKPALSIPYCHHERWDGQGYPQGLKAEEIPLPARLFAIVDQWEALSSDRVYRSAWDRETIVAYIREHAGKIYDPHIADLFLSLI